MWDLKTLAKLNAQFEKMLSRPSRSKQKGKLRLKPVGVRKTARTFPSDRSRIRTLADSFRWL